MQDMRIDPPDSKFPTGWHAVLNDFVLDVLTVEYFYGEVVASVSMDRSPVPAKLRVWLLSEAPRPLRGEATNVLDQIHDRIQERARATCSICGSRARGSKVSHCGKHSDIQLVPYAVLKPPSNPAWRLADFHMLIDGTREDVFRTMAGNQQQLDAAAAFVQIYHAPEVSQTLARAQSMRALGAIETTLSH